MPYVAPDLVSVRLDRDAVVLASEIDDLTALSEAGARNTLYNTGSKERPEIHC